MLLQRTKRLSIQRRFLLCCLCSVFCSGFLLAQKNTSNPSAASNGWQLDATVNGVQFFHKIIDCSGTKLVFLKFNNTNQKAVKVTWKEAFTVKEGNARKNAGSMDAKQLEILPGETAQTDCNSNAQRELIARPAQTTPVYTGEVETFKFVDIKVSK